MFNSFTNWLNNLPVPVPFQNVTDNKTEEDIKKTDSNTDLSNKTSEKPDEFVVTHQDKPVSDLDTNIEKPETKKDQVDIDDNTNIQNQIHLDTQVALETAKEFGAKLLTFGLSATKQIQHQLQETASQIKDVLEKNALINDFSKENEKFVQEKKTQQRREEAAVPPWVGYVEEENLKEQILALSMDPRNFLRNPPNGVEFQFDSASSYPIALATLDEDPNLKEMRFKLVPSKITEALFWRNYFYRVSLIKQSTQLNLIANERVPVTYFDEKASKDATKIEKNVKTAKKYENTDVNTIDTTPASEFVSDQYEDQINEEEIKRDMRQLKLDKLNDSTILDDIEWDKDLQEDIDNINAEDLEKEIDQIIKKDAKNKI